MSPYPLLQSQWLLSLINLLSTRHFSVFPGGWVIKNLPAMQETRVRSLGQEDPMEEDMATHSSILAWENPMDSGAWWATVHGVAKRRTWLSNFTFFSFLVYPYASLWGCALYGSGQMYNNLCPSWEFYTILWSWKFSRLKIFIASL